MFVHQSALALIIEDYYAAATNGGVNVCIIVRPQFIVVHDRIAVVFVPYVDSEQADIGYRC